MAENIRQWEELESRVLMELSDLIDSTDSYLIDEEIEALDFVWRGRNVHYEKFLKVNWDCLENPFKDSRIHDRIDEEWAVYDKEHEHDKVPEDLIRLRVAKDYRHDNFSTEKRTEFLERFMPRCMSILRASGPA